MREIKFRIYSKDYGMQYPNRYLLSSFDFGVATEHYIDDSTSFYPITDRDNTLMQYTGLKDKSGKEIYEGDVVEFNSIDGMTRPTDKIERHVVKFYDSTQNNPFSGFFIPWNRYGTLYQVDKSTIKIIGNIYENPELNENPTS